MFLVASHNISDQGLASIRRLWRENKDTNQIARELNYREPEVANVLAYLRDNDMSRGVRWTIQEDTELRKLYTEEYSASQIAGLMGGGLTRNAVIGRVHRLKLPPRGAGRMPGQAVRQARNPRAPRPQHRLRIVAPPREQTVLRCAEIEPLHLGLEDIADNQCRYPFGDGPFTFCGHVKLADFSYCGPHHFLSIGPGTSSERTADRVTPRHLEAVK